MDILIHIGLTMLITAAGLTPIFLPVAVGIYLFHKLPRNHWFHRAFTLHPDRL